MNNPKKDNEKSVPLRQPKTTSNVLKPITESNIISQERKILEKTNIFDVETITIEHPKNYYQISKTKNYY